MVAVVVVLVVCHACGELLRRCGQPRVIGEIVGGLLLGPSVLGQVWPHAALFPADIVVQLDRVAQLGLIFFMASLGGLRCGAAIGRRVVSWVTAGSLGVPLAGGALIGSASGAALAGRGAPPVACAVFFGLALAVTALPVLGRILVDQGLAQTTVGVVAISAAAIGDLLVWATLPLLLIAAGGGTTPWTTTTWLGLVVLVAAVPVIRWAVVRSQWLTGADVGDGDRRTLLILIVGALGLGTAAELGGLHPAIGAFVFGLTIPAQAARIRRVLRRLQEITLVVLLPLFFAGVGLRTSVTLLTTPGQWSLFAAVLLVAVSTKIIGAGVGARLAGLPAADAWRTGVLMNCRGVTELIVSVIGLQHGLISPLGFTVLVLVAAITTTITTPLLRAGPGWPTAAHDGGRVVRMTRTKDLSIRC
jgi:Kef-type K+ transport system membrane component KefB